MEKLKVVVEAAAFVSLQTKLQKGC